MTIKRTRYQGAYNILQFNSHLFWFSGFLVILLIILAFYLNGLLSVFCFIAGCLIAFTTIISLVVSYYIYDASNFYDLNWLPNLALKKVININAGFDETSSIIQQKYPSCSLSKADFYNPMNHTERSIKKARVKYPNTPDTIVINSVAPQLPTNEYDYVLLTFAAHEIRNDHERILFFSAIKKSMKPNGALIVTEHLRDTANFFAYNIGFFHFLPKHIWLQTFTEAGFYIADEIKHNPFFRTFIIYPQHGTTP